MRSRSTLQIGFTVAVVVAAALAANASELTASIEQHYTGSTHTNIPYSFVAFYLVYAAPPYESIGSGVGWTNETTGGHDFTSEYSFDRFVARLTNGVDEQFWLAAQAGTAEGHQWGGVGGGVRAYESTWLNRPVDLVGLNVERIHLEVLALTFASVLEPTGSQYVFTVDATLRWEFWTPEPGGALLLASLLAAARRRG